tara:strand:- start:152 stop:352 length:201 start_codon:yes stop_codon:yes gene_type:complete
MRGNNISSVIAFMMVLLTSGCVMPPMTETKIPQFLEELKTHQFSVEEKQTIGKLLHYINDLENNVR